MLKNSSVIVAFALWWLVSAIEVRHAQAGPVLQELSTADPARPRLKNRPVNHKPLFLGPSFWKQYDAPEIFSEIFNGSFEGDSASPFFRRIFIEFVSEFHENCADYLSPGYRAFRINNAGELSTEILRVDPHLANFYLQYWNTSDAWGTVDVLGARVDGKPSRVFSPGFIVPQLFNRWSCVSTEMWQLEKNLLRIAKGEKQLSPPQSNKFLQSVKDPQTGLLWTSHDALWDTYYRVRLDWDEATEYCNNLTLGNYSDWHLPEINQLDQLFDESAPASECEEGGHAKCYIRLGIRLSVFRIWSSTKDPHRQGNSYVKFFNLGGGSSFGDGDRYLSSVLCVHQPPKN